MSRECLQCPPTVKDRCLKVVCLTDEILAEKERMDTPRPPEMTDQEIHDIIFKDAPDWRSWFK